MSKVSQQRHVRKPGERRKSIEPILCVPSSSPLSLSSSKQWIERRSRMFDINARCGSVLNIGRIANARNVHCKMCDRVSYKEEQWEE